MSKPIRMPQADEQIVLEELQVELVHPEALPRFQSLLRRHHYLGGIKPVGRRLYYVAAWRGQWLALLVFCAVANICVIGRSGLAGRKRSAASVWGW